MRFSKSSNLLCTAMILAACGGGGGATTPSASGSVDAAGGTVKLPNGPTIQVPAGAVAGPTTLTVSQMATQAPSGALSPIFKFGPDGATFASPVTVTFSVPAGTTAASIYWTKAGSATEYESVPTTISGTTATAQVTHFSGGYVGALDVAGTWTGTMNFTNRDAQGAIIGISAIRQARDVSQNEDAVVYASTGSNGWTGSCSGTISGNSLNATATDSCQIVSLDGNCRYTPTRIEVIDNTTSPMTMTSTWTGTFVGANCPGLTVEAHATYTRESAPPLDVSGTWSSTGNWTNTGPGLPPVSGTSSGTKVRTQTGSRVIATNTGSTGSTTSCKGVIIGNTIYASCLNTSTPCVQSGSSTVTVNASASPMTDTATNAFNLAGACGGYTALTGSTSGTRTGP